MGQECSVQKGLQYSPYQEFLCVFHVCKTLFCVKAQNPHYRIIAKYRENHIV